MLDMLKAFVRWKLGVRVDMKGMGMEGALRDRRGFGEMGIYLWDLEGR